MMKYIGVFALFCLACTCLRAQGSQVVWSDSLVLSATALPVTAPRLTLGPDGALLATWGTSSANGSQIWCSRQENGVFSAPVGATTVNPSLFGFGGYDVAVSAAHVFIVFERLQSGIWLTRSADGGLSFEPPVQVQEPITGGYVTISSITVDDVGNPLVSYIQEKNPATYQLRRSIDAGETFLDPVTVNTPAPGGAVCECCASDLLASGDSVWVVFRNNNMNIRDMWVSRSIDEAAAFDVATDVDDTDWQIATCPISGPRMARCGDSLMVTWMSQVNGTPRVHLSSLHAGSMIKGQQIGFPSTATQSVPDIAGRGDTLGVVFLEQSKEIVFLHSVKGIEGLQEQPQRFAVPNHSLQYPSLAYQNGIFHLIYADPAADLVLYRKGVVSVASAVAEPEQAGVEIYPNPLPAQARTLQVRCTNGCIRQVQLYDPMGRMLFNTQPESEQTAFEFPVGTAGWYVLRVQTDHGVVVRSIFCAAAETGR